MESNFIVNDKGIIKDKRTHKKKVCKKYLENLEKYKQSIAGQSKKWRKKSK